MLGGMAFRTLGNPSGDTGATVDPGVQEGRVPSFPGNDQQEAAVRDLQVRACVIVSTTSLLSLSLLFFDSNHSVFGFRNDPTPYISEVNGLLAAGKFDKATFAVVGLRFEFQFVPHLIGPLLVEDKVTVLEELVKSHKELQLEVVKVREP